MGTERAFEAGKFVRLDEYEEKLEDFETELVDVRDTLKDEVEDHEFSLAELKEQIREHKRLFQEVQRRLSELETEKTKSEGLRESVSRQVQSFERKVKEAAPICQERDVEASRMMEQALRECTKQRELEELARDLAQLKENNKETPAATPAKPAGAAGTPVPQTPAQGPSRGLTLKVTTNSSQFRCLDEDCRLSMGTEHCL